MIILLWQQSPVIALARSQSSYNHNQNIRQEVSLWQQSPVIALALPEPSPPKQLCESEGKSEDDTDEYIDKDIDRDKENEKKTEMKIQKLHSLRHRHLNNSVSVSDSDNHGGEDKETDK